MLADAVTVRIAKDHKGDLPRRSLEPLAIGDQTATDQFAANRVHRLTVQPDNKSLKYKLYPNLVNQHGPIKCYVAAGGATAIGGRNSLQEQE